jgi:hypothetical protein
MIDHTTGIITTVAGNGTVGNSGDGGQATAAQIRFPYGVCVDKMGSIYIADRDNHRIRMVDPTGTISTIAGNGNMGFSGDGSPATIAELNHPSGVTLDSCNNLYIADKENKRVRKVTYNTSCSMLNVNTATPLTFTLSPNPATTTLTITSNNKLKEFTLRSTLGQALLHQTCNTQKATLDIEHLPTGIYFINVTDNTGHQRTEKLIKQ